MGTDKVVVANQSVNSRWGALPAGKDSKKDGGAEIELKFDKFRTNYDIIVGGQHIDKGRGTDVHAFRALCTKKIMEYYQKYLETKPQLPLTPHAFLHKITNEVLYQAEHLRGKGKLPGDKLNLDRVLATLFQDKKNYALLAVETRVGSAKKDDPARAQLRNLVLNALRPMKPLA